MLAISVRSSAASGRLSGVCSITGRVLDRGEPDEAREQYKPAIVDPEKIRFRPELALPQLVRAELLPEHYPDERAEALEQLVGAAPEFLRS